MEIKELDFSIFHPLDHHPFGAECRAWHGGSWNHLKLTWTLRRWPQIRGIAFLLLCRINIHYEEVWWRGDMAKVCCHHCDFTRPPSDEEKEASKPPWLK